METLKLLTPDQIKDIDKYAVEELGFPEILLMENAAHSVLKEIKKRFRNYEIVVICGPGNNGGDGLALARLLKYEKFNIKISRITEKEYKGSPGINYNLCSNIEEVNLDSINISKSTLIVDAMFGIGLNRPLDLDIERKIDLINNSPAKILSIDIPSGVSGLTGNILGNIAVKADVTVTLCAPKVGLYLFPGFSYCGQIITAGLPIPNNVFDPIKAPRLNTPLSYAGRSRDSNKRSYSRVLSISGSESYYGAPFFSSKSALISGSGYSTLITTDEVKRVCASIAPEVIYRRESDLVKSIEDSTAVVFGPGVGLDKRSRRLFKSVILSNPDNLIIDGDGITLAAEDIKTMENYNKLFVITPHAGEASRLITTTIDNINRNPIKYSLQISKKYNCITVLKGAHTIITTPEEDIFINICSSQSLATAGSGDILSGVIAGLTGYLPLLDAVRAGVYIHGLTGLLLEKKIGKIGSTALDIINTLPEAVNMYNYLSTSDALPAL